MNKKGFVKIMEAVIAIVIIFIFMFTIIPSYNKVDKIPDNIELFQKEILSEIQSNESLREDVLSYLLTYIDTNDQTEKKYSINTVMNYRNDPTVNIDKFIRANLPPILEYNYTVCTEFNGLLCIPDLLHPDQQYQDVKIPSNKAVYAKSLIIANSTQTNTFRLYLWENF